MAYIAGTSAVAPSGPRLLFETFKLTNAPLSWGNKTMPWLVFFGQWQLTCPLTCRSLICLPHTQLLLLEYQYWKRQEWK